MRFWRTPLDAHQIKIPHGEIHLVVDRCKGCEFCTEYCPCGVLAMSTDFNAKGYFYACVVEQPRCIGCRLCAITCPDVAIEIGVHGTQYNFFPY